jgi:hypothetical protein
MRLQWTVQRLLRRQILKNTRYLMQQMSKWVPFLSWQIANR